jgi:hypothetical protein
MQCTAVTSSRGNDRLELRSAVGTNGSISGTAKLLDVSAQALPYDAEVLVQCAGVQPCVPPIVPSQHGAGHLING